MRNVPRASELAKEYNRLEENMVEEVLDTPIDNKKSKPVPVTPDDTYNIRKEEK